MNKAIKWLPLFLGWILFSCEEWIKDGADGCILVKTKGVVRVTEISDNFVVGEGEIEEKGKALPNDYNIVSKGLIYGTDSSMLEIKSHSYDYSNYNSYYDCFQPYIYTTVSLTASVVNVRIQDTMWRDNGLIHGFGYWQAAGYGNFFCLFSDLTGGTRYYYRAFAHVSDDNGFDKYLYGEVKEFVSGGITQDPTVFIPIDALGIGVMKEDLFQTGIGLNAIRGCSQFNFDGGVGGYTDWRVPTIAQLREIYKFRTQIGGFKSAWYFSCEEGESPFYYYWDFATNTQGCEQSNGYGRQDGYVRLVRPLP